MTPEEAADATPEALKAANVETGKAMIADGQDPAKVAAWLHAQLPGAFADDKEAGAALA